MERTPASGCCVEGPPPGPDPEGGGAPYSKSPSSRRPHAFDRLLLNLGDERLRILTDRFDRAATHPRGSTPAGISGARLGPPLHPTKVASVTASSGRLTRRFGALMARLVLEMMDFNCGALCGAARSRAGRAGRLLGGRARDEGLFRIFREDGGHRLLERGLRVVLRPAGDPAFRRPRPDELPMLLIDHIDSERTFRHGADVPATQGSTPAPAARPSAPAEADIGPRAGCLRPCLCCLR